MRAPLILIAALPLAACATAEGGMVSSSTAPRATAALVDATGAAKGRATIVQEGSALRVTVDASGMPAGPHGLHLHMVGRCDAPDFTTAGGHWNPTAMKHGKDAPQGPHSGDLPNLDIGSSGNGKLSFTIPNATLTGGETALLDADGAAIVVHAAADDYRTDPSGNSGGRIACGVVTAS